MGMGFIDLDLHDIFFGRSLELVLVHVDMHWRQYPKTSTLQNTPLTSLPAYRQKLIRPRIKLSSQSSVAESQA